MGLVGEELAAGFAGDGGKVGLGLCEVGFPGGEFGFSLAALGFEVFEGGVDLFEFVGGPRRAGAEVLEAGLALGVAPALGVDLFVDAGLECGALGLFGLAGGFDGELGGMDGGGVGVGVDADGIGGADEVLSGSLS